MAMTALVARGLALRCQLSHTFAGEQGALYIRLWRQVLEIDPENTEAQRGIRDLTGSSF